MSLGPWQTFWILFYGFFTYGFAGSMREQVCKYMCPYARFQSAMFDKDTLIVTYDARRGEPRGARAKKADPAKLSLGDCIDCELCEQVCPVGIDIRNGLQYECIACAACVDSCNQVMEKLGYNRGLVRYTTQNAVAGNLSKRDIWHRVVRTRTLIYISLFFAIVFAAVMSLTLRVPLKVDVIRDRGLPRELDAGAIENVYRLQIMNTAERPRSFRVGVSGIPGIAIDGAGQIDMQAASTRAVPIRVHVPHRAVPAGSHSIRFDVRAEDDAAVMVEEKGVFLVP